MISVKKYKTIMVTLLYFVLHIIASTDGFNDLLLKINENSEFWDNYLNVIFYGSFFVLLFLMYRKQLINDIKNLKKLKFNQVAIIIAIILVGMVISAIILSNLGIYSDNQVAVEESVTKYKISSFFYVVLFGPFVEEMIFRFHIYNFLRYKKDSKVNMWISIIITSILFAVYHCDIADIIHFNYMQLISQIPILILGLGLCVIREKTSNIASSIIVHMLINSI